MVFAIVNAFSFSQESSTDCCAANQDDTMTAKTRKTLIATNRTPNAARLPSSPAFTLIRSARKLLKKIMTQPCAWVRKVHKWCVQGDSKAAVLADGVQTKFDADTSEIYAFLYACRDLGVF